MKILFFNSATLNYGGGGEISFMGLGKWLSARGHKVYYITGSQKFCNSYCKLMGSVHTKNITDKDLREKYNVGCYCTYDYKDIFFKTNKKRKIKKIFEEADYVISKNEIIPIIIMKLFRINFKKIVLIFQTPLFYPSTKTVKSKIHNLVYNSRVYSNFIRMYRLIFLRKSEREKLKEIDGNIKAKIIPNSINTKKFYQKKYKKGKKFKVYYIGRMTEQKGIDILYDSILKMSKSKEFRDIEFYFVGSGNQEHYLRDLSRKFKNCHFLGFKTDVVKFYRDADISIAPSRWEGFPNAVLEAQSTGTPIITTDIPGCRDIVKDDKTGWICKVNDSIDLLDKTLLAYNLWRDNFVEFKKIGLNARKNVVVNYEENMINKKIEKFLVGK